MHSRQPRVDSGLALMAATTPGQLRFERQPCIEGGHALKAAMHEGGHALKTAMHEGSHALKTATRIEGG